MAIYQMAFMDGSPRLKKFVIGAGALALIAGLVGIAVSGVLSGRHFVHTDHNDSTDPAAVARRVLTSVPLIDGYVCID